MDYIWNKIVLVYKTNTHEICKEHVNYNIESKNIFKLSISPYIYTKLVKSERAVNNE